MIARTSSVSLPGPLHGAGVDVVSLHRVSERLSRAKFSEQEQASFAAQRELPFAGREAVLKAVGGPGILAAPLRAMAVAWVAGELVFTPEPAYRDVMEREGVAAVRLTVLALSAAHVVVTALASRSGEPMRVSQAYAAVAPSPAHLDTLTPDEVAECRRRHDPSPSAAARVAARAATQLLVPGASVHVDGARDRPPRLVGVDRPVALSLAHERDLAVAFVAMQAPDGSR